MRIGSSTNNKSLLTLETPATIAERKHRIKYDQAMAKRRRKLRKETERLQKSMRHTPRILLIQNSNPQSIDIPKKKSIIDVSVVTNGSSNQIPPPPARNQLNFPKLRGVPIFQFRRPNQATSKTQTSSNPTETNQDSSRVRDYNRSARKLPKFPGCIVS